jgi:hypothetical protein
VQQSEDRWRANRDLQVTGREGVMAASLRKGPACLSAAMNCVVHMASVTNTWHLPVIW